MSRVSRIRVAIDRLVLRGVPAGDAAVMRAALAAELAARLAGADATVLRDASAGGPRRLDIGGAGSTKGVGTEAGRALAAALGAPAGRGQR